MATYRIYFFGEGSICGRHDFSAECDHGAIRIAHVLFEACKDRCQSFDLWQGTRHVTAPRQSPPATFDELSAAHQECVIETEEQIVRSEWNIARSRRLLEALAKKSRDAGNVPS